MNDTLIWVGETLKNLDILMLIWEFVEFVKDRKLL
jgi:hypothetical protein